MLMIDYRIYRLTSLASTKSTAKLSCILIMVLARQFRSKINTHAHVQFLRDLKITLGLYLLWYTARPIGIF